MAFQTTEQVAPLRNALTRIVDGRRAIKSVRITFPAMQLQRKPPLAGLSRDPFSNGGVLHYRDEERYNQ
jgi:hypothetical protein